MATFSTTKDPNEVLPYQMDWTAWLAGDTLATSTWLVTGGGDTLIVDSDTNNATVTTVWLSGGSRGRTYIVTNRVTTTDLKTADRSIQFKLVEK